MIWLVNTDPDQNHRGGKAKCRYDDPQLQGTPPHLGDGPTQSARATQQRTGTPHGPRMRRLEPHIYQYQPRITEVRPCIPRPGRSAPPADSRDPSRPWRAVAAHGRSPDECPRDAGIPTCSKSTSRVNTWRGLRASATRRSNSKGVNEICSPLRVTLWAGTSMSMSAIESISAGSSSLRRRRARNTGDQFLGLNGFADVVVRAGFQPSTTSTVSVFAVSMTIGTPESAQHAADVDAVHAGQHEVQQD